jgi:hypothetical protein
LIHTPSLVRPPHVHNRSPLHLRPKGTGDKGKSAISPLSGISSPLPRSSTFSLSLCSLSVLTLFSHSSTRSLRTCISICICIFRYVSASVCISSHAPPSPLCPTTYLCVCASIDGCVRTRIHSHTPSLSFSLSLSLSRSLSLSQSPTLTLALTPSHSLTLSLCRCNGPRVYSSWQGALAGASACSVQNQASSQYSSLLPRRFPTVRALTLLHSLTPLSSSHTHTHTHYLSSSQTVSLSIYVCVSLPYLSYSLSDTHSPTSPSNSLHPISPVTAMRELSLSHSGKNAADLSTVSAQVTSGSASECGGLWGTARLEHHC